MLEGENITIFWDFTMQTDRTKQANWLNIIVKDFKIYKWYRRDIAIPSDKIIAVKNWSATEIARMWHLNINSIPVIIVALEMIKKYGYIH